jgi:hypothetical protein
MHTRFRFVSSILLVILVAFVVAPLLRADEWNKETIVTFSRAVEVPGQVLPAGKYVFKLADSRSDRRIVQIFSEDRTKLMATILATPDYRLAPTDQTVISLEERPSGNPEAVGSWFYPGDNYGSKFVYPASRMTLAAGSQPANQSSTSAVGKTPAAVPPAETFTAPPTESSVVENENRQDPAQQAPVQLAKSAPAMLPRTSSNFLLLPLAGFVFVCAGLLVLRYAGQES